MKLTVIKYLNARIGEPSTNAECRIYKSPGDVIETDRVVAGTEIDGNAVWYHCTDDDCYYWSGGTSDPGQPLTNLNELDDIAQIQIINSLAKSYEGRWNIAIPGFQGYGTGVVQPSSNLGLIIYVLDKKAVPPNLISIPLLFKGILLEVNITEVEKIEHQNYIQPRSDNIPCLQLDNSFPYQLGGTISEEGKGSYGSRTVRLFKQNPDKTYDCYIMSCFHVLLNDLKSRRSFGPFPASSGRVAVMPGTMNKANRHPGTYPILEGYYNPVMDFAVARINKDMISNDFLSQAVDGYYTYNMLNSLMKKTVKMIGSTSFTQTGLITAIHCSRKVGDNNWLFRNCLIAERMSAEGDSGAPVVDDRHKLVGYIIAGNAAKNETIILPFFPVFANTRYQLIK